MKTSEVGISLIKHFEGVRLKPYRCPALLWTVGVGHVLYPRQHHLTLEERMHFQLAPAHNRTFTQEEVNDLLRNDLRRFERGVERLCGRSTTQSQFDALVSFAFNLGFGALQRSTLRRKHLRKDYAGAASEFLKFVRAGGKVLPGLQRRRIAERILYVKHHDTGDAGDD